MEANKSLVTLSPLAVMPVMEMAHAVARRQAIIDLVKNSGIWVDGVHSGRIPGTEKPTLLKPGAELLCSLFGLSDRMVLVHKVEDWDGSEHGGEPLFFYHYTCQLWQGEHFVAEADGSCNSREARYRWRWVEESEVPPELDKATLKKRTGTITEFDFAIERGETSGKYGKPAEYWQQFREAIAAGRAIQTVKETKSGQHLKAWTIETTVYRIPNDDIASLVNTVKKQAQKRALVAATLIACTASEMFSQDLEDLTEGVIEGTARIVETPTTEPQAERPERRVERPRGREATPEEAAAAERVTMTAEERKLQARMRQVRAAMENARKLFQFPEEPDALIQKWLRARWDKGSLAEVQADMPAILKSISEWAEEYAETQGAAAAQEGGE